MHYCLTCGLKLESGDRFCSRCGKENKVFGKQHRRIITVAVIILLLLAGAVILTVVTGNGSDNYFPLETGRTYLYHLELDPPAESDEISTLTITFTGPKTINGKRYIGRKIVPASGEIDIIVQYFRETGEGIFVVQPYDEDEDHFSEEHLYMPLPLEVGMTWGPGQFEHRVEAFETVTVPAGSFRNCAKISVKTDFMDYIYYLAPGVGPVKTIYTYSNGDTSTSSLVEYSR